MVTSPLVSVLVTTFDDAPFVEESLDSLPAQTWTDFEVFITDDASTDGTADVIEAWLRRTGYPAEFLRNDTNRGICANHNTALSRTCGRFVCSLSGDDAYEPHHLEHQLRCMLEQSDEVAAVYSDMVLVDERGEHLERSFLTQHLGDEPPPEGAIFRRLIRGNFLPAPATMVRREALDAVGGYDESLAYEDYDMWLKLSNQFLFRYLPGQVVRYRVHATSMSNDPRWRPALRESRMRILASWLGRAGEAEPLLIEQLWQSGKLRLLKHDDDLARFALTAAARADGRLRKRLLAGAVGLPGGCSAMRSAATLRRRLASRA